MEITRVEAYAVKSSIGTQALPGDSTYWSAGVSPVVIKIHTDENVIGIGETFFDSIRDVKFVAHNVDSFSEYLLGKDPRNVVKIWHELYTHVKRTGSYAALSAIDEALWDIKGKDADKPVYQLLGGETTELDAYATFPIEKTTDELGESAKWLSEKGFEALKIMGGYGVEKDRERIETVHENIPDSLDLAIDANTSYDYTTALSVARTASDYELAWFEEPISHDDIEGQARLNSSVSVPISGFQTHTTHYTALEHLKNNALEIYQPRLDYVGGITAADRVCTLVEAFNKEVIPHAFGPAINYAATLHVAAASNACSLVEFAIFSDDTVDPGKYVTSPYVENRDEIYVQDGGRIAPLEKPGIGVEVDDHYLEEHKVGYTSS